MNMSLKVISEYNQTYRKHTSCYYCLGLTLCYLQAGLPKRTLVLFSLRKHTTNGDSDRIRNSRQITAVCNNRYTS